MSVRNIDGETPLYLAVEENRAALIPALLERRADIFAADNKGITPLVKVLNENTDMLNVLITEGTAALSDSGGNTPLHIAVRNHAGADTINLILDKKASINARNKEGDTSLHLAVRQNEKEAGEVLTARGADIFGTNARGESPLFLSFPANSNPRSWMINAATLKARDSLGNSVLHYAAQWKLDSQIRWLVDSGFNPETANATGETPVFTAAKVDSPSTIRSLINVGALAGTRDKQGNTALHAAVRWNAKNAAETLLIAGLDPNRRNQSGRAPFHDAVQQGHADIETILIKYKADIEIRDNEGNSPLMEAVRNRSSQAVDRLINTYHADPLTSNLRGDTPLHIAVSTEQDVIIRLLLGKGASIHLKNAQGKTPFQLALARSEPETSARLVSLLLSGGGVNSPDDKGASPLHIAITEGASHNMIQLILDLGARLSNIDAEGFTPLRLAINRNDWVLASLLSEKGSDLFFKAGDGKCPTDIAINRGGEAIEALFTRRTIDARDTSGNTVLHYAAHQGSTELIRRLINQGAKTDARNISNESPGDIARRWGRDSEIISLLN